jgi:hypothetical protein
VAVAGARVHLAHPLGVKGFAYRRVKNDKRDAGDLADLLRMGRLPEAWVAPPAVRGLREMVRHRCKLVALRSGLKAQVHAVLAKQGMQVPVSDLFGVSGSTLLDELGLDGPYQARVCSLRRLIEAFSFEIDRWAKRTAAQLAGHRGYRAVQAIGGVGPVLAAVFAAEIGEVTRFARPQQLCSWAGMTPASRVGTQDPPWADHQAGQPAGPLGRHRSGATSPRRPDGGHPQPAGRTPRREHRQGRRRRQAAHPRLLRATRRADPLPDPTSVSTLWTQPGRAVAGGLIPTDVA